MRRLALIAALALTAGGAAAQTMPVQPEQVAFRAGYSAEKIETFAAVAREVATMREAAMTRYFEVEGEAARRALIRQANLDIKAAITEAEGLSLAEFERINAEARTDRALNRHIARALRDLERAE